MPREILYNTGRFYDSEQVLEITLADDLSYATFDDPSRLMSGMRVDFSEFRQRLIREGLVTDNGIGEWIADAYDHNAYSYT